MAWVAETVAGRVVAEREEVMAKEVVAESSVVVEMTAVCLVASAVGAASVAKEVMAEGEDLAEVAVVVTVSVAALEEVLAEELTVAARAAAGKGVVMGAIRSSRQRSSARHCPSRPLRRCFLQSARLARLRATRCDACRDSSRFLRGYTHPKPTQRQNRVRSQCPWRQRAPVVCISAHRMRCSVRGLGSMSRYEGTRPCLWPRRHIRPQLH